MERERGDGVILDFKFFLSLSHVVNFSSLSLRSCGDSPIVSIVFNSRPSIAWWPVSSSSSYLFSLFPFSSPNHQPDPFLTFQSFALFTPPKLIRIPLSLHRTNRQLKIDHKPKANLRTLHKPSLQLPSRGHPYLFHPPFFMAVVSCCWSPFGLSLCNLVRASTAHSLSTQDVYIHIPPFHPSSSSRSSILSLISLFSSSHFFLLSAFHRPRAFRLFAFHLVSSAVFVLSCTTACPSSCPLISYLLYPPPRTVVCFSTYLIVKHGSRN